MPVSRLLASGLGCALAAVLAAATANMTARGEMAVTLEAIVKFTDASSVGAPIASEVGRMLQEGSTDLARLAQPLGTFAGTIGIPLEARGITSGRELVVGIREGDWLAAVERACRDDDAVAHVALVDVRSDASLLATHRVEVRFEESNPERRVVAAAFPEAPRSERVQALAESLAASSGVPVRGAAIAEDRLGLAVDRPAGLALLVERLRASDAVEYAQPNTLLQIQ